MKPDSLPPPDCRSTDLKIVVETPQGSSNKFKLDAETGLFKLGFAMPAGMAFPFEFGFIPSTLGDDGDPLDILVLMDSATFAGCLVRARLIGVLEASQKEEGKAAERNDRLIAVAAPSTRHQKVCSLRDLAKPLLAEIEHFFMSYNELRERKFKVLARKGPEAALRVIKRGVEKLQKSREGGQ